MITGLYHTMLMTTNPVGIGRQVAQRRYVAIDSMHRHAWPGRQHAIACMKFNRVSKKVGGYDGGSLSPTRPVLQVVNTFPI